MKIYGTWLFLIGHFIGILAGPSVAQALEMSDIVDEGLFVQSVTHGKEVPDSWHTLHDIVPRIYLMDISPEFATEAWCSGLLIAPDVVLTAAHCLTSDPEHMVIQVYFPGKVIEASSFTKHPDFKPLRIVKKGEGPSQIVGGYNDVALIFLSEKSASQPAQLYAKALQPGSKKEVILSGFGFLGPDKPNSAGSLHYANVTAQVLTEGRMTVQGEKNSCSGDSGGPLLLRQNNRWISVGLVSFGDCQNESKHMQTSYFVEWIEEEIKKAHSFFKI